MPADASRRRFLQLGTVAGIAGITGCTTVPVGDQTPEGESPANTEGESSSSDSEPTDNTEPGATERSGWPARDFDVGRTRLNPGTSDPGPIGAERWSYPALVQPLVTAGSVFFGDDETVYAYDLTDGTEVWAKEGYPFVVLQSVDDGTLYAVHDDGVAALDVESGAEQWNATVDTVYLSVTDGTVFAAGEPMVHALDAATGKIKWERNLGSGWLNPPAVGEDRLFVLSLIDGVLALDPATGEERWKYAFDTPDDDALGPVFSDGGVLFSYFRTVYEVAASDGTIRWEYSVPNQPRLTAPVVTPDAVYVGHLLSDQSGVDAIDRADGSQRWSTEIPGRIGFGRALSGARSSLYVAGVGGPVQTIDLEGNLRRQDDSRDYVGSPIPANNHLLINVQGEGLYVFR